MMPVFIIAEAGVNHNGTLDLALRLVDAAVQAGANAVKFQTFQASLLATASAVKAPYQQQTTDPTETQVAMLTKLMLSHADHYQLMRHCQKQNIIFLSTPFDLTSLHFLVHDLGMTTIKLSSGTVTHGPLLLAASQTRVNMILSTGMSHLQEVREALAVLAFGLTEESTPTSSSDFQTAFESSHGQSALANHVQLMHCTTAYPAPFADVNLRAMTTLNRAFHLPVGLSDHTPGFSVALAAVARGATTIEKHLTLDRNMPGPDHRASLEPDEFTAMVRGIHEVELALGHETKQPTAAETANRRIARTSLVALCAVAQGESWTQNNLGVKRPGTGISPMAYWQWLGRKASRTFSKDEIIEE